MSAEASNAAVETVFAALRADAALAPLPRIYQFAQGYGALYNAALAAPGVVLVAWAQGGDKGARVRGVLEAWHDVVVSVCENTAPGKNTTGADAASWAQAIIRAVGAGRNTEVANRAYDLGKADEGICVYFVNLRVRTFETLKL